jgi:hypothetical protein
MAALRKSGSVVVFHWEGAIPPPDQAEFAAALQQRRFRTIENAASEEVSVGWVTPADPTGDSFAPEDLDGGAAAWLRFRIDRKKLPLRWLQIHRDAAEKARGKKLSARERRELKDDLTEKLLPRVLPTIQLVDALLHHERAMVLLFAQSRTARETFGKLFFETFGVPLQRHDPLAAGLRAGLGAEARHRLERLEPVRWPSAERPAAPPRRSADAGAEAGARAGTGADA